MNKKINLKNKMFEKLDEINSRPKPFEIYTAEHLWNDKYISKKMLECHLSENIDPASRKKAFLKKSADRIISKFNIGTETKICDFGCGPGLYTTRFAEKGADVTGIDFSENSIKYAKKTTKQKNLKIDYVLQNYLNFTTNKKFDLITLIYDDFCPLSPAQRKFLLKKFHNLLDKDGAILLDVLSINFFNETTEKNSFEFVSDKGFWSPNPYYLFSNTFKYQEEKVVLDKYTIIEKEQTWEIFNWLQCFNLKFLEKELQENGFRIIENYSDVTGTPYKPDSKEIEKKKKKL